MAASAETSKKPSAVAPTIKPGGLKGLGKPGGLLGKRIISGGGANKFAVNASALNKASDKISGVSKPVVPPKAAAVKEAEKKIVPKEAEKKAPPKEAEKKAAPVEAEKEKPKPEAPLGTESPMNLKITGAPAN